MRGRALLADDLDRIGLSQLVEPNGQADTLAPRELGLGRMPTQEQARQLAVTEESVELVGCHVDKEQHHQPDLDHQKAWPRELRDEKVRKIAKRSTIAQVMQQAFGDAEYEHS